MGTELEMQNSVPVEVCKAINCPWLWPAIMRSVNTLGGLDPVVVRTFLSLKTYV